MSEVVLDSSAVLALIDREPGYEAVVGVMPGALLGTVNLIEVLSKLIDRGIPAAVAKPLVTGLGAVVVDLDSATAALASEMRSATRTCGLSLGDRACLALASRSGASVLTADAAWEKVAEAVGVKVRNIRPRL